VKLICANANIWTVRLLVPIARKGLGWKAMCIDQESLAVTVERPLHGLGQPVVVGEVPIVHQFLALGDRKTRPEL
jgi:hypothetical protein